MCLRPMAALRWLDANGCARVEMTASVPTALDGRRPRVWEAIDAPLHDPAGACETHTIPNSPVNMQGTGGRKGSAEQRRTKRL